ncbi:conserved hypothetical protein [Histoplasma capsulatum var. duboisii H88]|uniref:Uncharacterized protein n=1 Tax=Ajellomyces capsulatus (strain H88) TaxID=544711 RepID=F0U9Q2_AJEC8|nr:conserved hypothetical protein [Histoplasma capsulatum var. duboisii H88]QSS51638.1 hypothetical protein I7I53_07006 [Histoplasma capsulatum var. duboisii H88]
MPNPNITIYPFPSTFSHAPMPQQHQHSGQEDLIHRLNTECFNLRLRLQQQSAVNTLIREELQTEKRFRLDLAEANGQLQQEVLRIQQKVITEQEHHWKTTAELDRLRKWCYRVDGLVDVMQLEEDSKLEVNDRSRQISDIIFDIESKLKDEYRSQFQKQDECIMKLQQAMNHDGMSARPLLPRRERARVEILD